MLALFFEVLPKPGHEDHYFRHVGMLKPALERHTGMLWLDRYKSLSRDGLILSHQLWQDEAAIISWREDEQHKASQAAGRNKHFADYRIRIAEIFLRADQGKPQQSFELQQGDGDFIVAAHSEGAPIEGMQESFSSVNHEGAFVGIATADHEAHAHELMAACAGQEHMTWCIAAHMKRDYGMFERDQAP